MFLKAAQCRISEFHVAKALHRAISKKGNILYTFPAGEQMQQFVDARVRQAVLNNPFLVKYVTGSLNLKKFSINHNSLYFRGAQKRRQIISVDASILFADEIAEYDEGTIYTLNKRLGNAENPERFYYSTPKFNGSDIALYYYGDEAQKERGSDQRVWTIKCERCGQWNENLIWELNTIDLNRNDRGFSHYEPNVITICRHCKKEINRLSANAEWVAKVQANSGYCHGYHIHKLFFPTGNLNAIHLDLQNPLKEQECKNSDLGLPYEVVGSRLTDSIIDNARGTHLRVWKSDVDTFAGVDIGNRIHIVLSQLDENQKIRVVNAQEVDDWADLHYIFKDYKIRSCVIDMNPDKDEAIDFQNKYEKRVWLAFFNQQMERSAILFEKNKDEGIVSIHRTLAMMRILDMIPEKDIYFPINIKEVADFYSHLKSVIKALKPDANNNMIPFFPKMKNPDHYFFALLYNMVATGMNPRPAVFRILKTSLT